MSDGAMDNQPLSDEEELQLLRLRKQKAMAAAQQSTVLAPAIPTPASARSPFWQGAAQGATLDFGDEIGGAVQALGQKFLPESLGGLSSEDAAKRGLGDLYRENRDMYRRENEAAQRESPLTYLGGNLTGGLSLIPITPGGEAKGLWNLVKAGAKTGSILGAVGGLGSSNADVTRGQVGQAAWDTAKGAAIGLGTGAALPVLAKAPTAGQKLLGLVRGGFVQATPEAQRLAQEGIQLTLGQMAPESMVGHMEELAANKATGGMLSEARNSTAKSARDLLLKKAAAPGAELPTAGTPIQSQLDELANGYSQIYDSALKGERVNPEQYVGQGKWRGLLTDEALKGSAKTRGAFELAARNPNIDATPAARDTAQAWLENQARALPGRTKDGKVAAESVQALRGRLRDKIRSLGEDPTGDDRARKEIYQQAEEFVSEMLNNQLPPEKASALQAVDASYNNLRAARAAAGKAFVQNQEFTPQQMLMSIKEKGSTPELERTARDAFSVLSAKYPRTGIQAAALEGIPGGHMVSQVAANGLNFVPFARNWATNGLWQPGLPSAAIGALSNVSDSVVNASPARAALIRALLERENESLSSPVHAQSPP